MIFSKKVEKMYSKTLFSRHDEDGSIFYFSHSDFDGLNMTPYSFNNQLGDKLSGGLYYYDGYDETRLIVFDHGMGTGHRAYMREIEVLARHGYRVLAYDHTGCTNSEGKGVRGLSGSLADLDACITAVKKDESLNKLTLSVVGHSWGAFSTMNITAFHKDIESIVAISGFISIPQMLKFILPGFLGLWRNTAKQLERAANPDCADISAIDTLRSSSTRALIIHSLDDKTCSAKLNFVKLRDALEDEENVTFLLENGKGHNPNYTEAAVKYKDKFFADLTKKRKSGELSTDEQKRAFIESYDWYKMTEQDEKVWQIIFDHLDAKA